MLPSVGEPGTSAHLRERGARRLGGSPRRPYLIDRDDIRRSNTSEHDPSGPTDHQGAPAQGDVHAALDVNAVRLNDLRPLLELGAVGDQVAHGSPPRRLDPDRRVAPAADGSLAALRRLARNALASRFRLVVRLVVSASFDAEDMDDRRIRAWRRHHLVHETVLTAAYPNGPAADQHPPERLPARRGRPDAVKSGAKLRLAY